MHRMIAAERQPGDDRVCRTARHDGRCGQRISHNPIVDLGVDRSLMHADACTTRSSTLSGFAKALNYVSLPRTVLILESDKKTPGMRTVVAVVPARPGIDKERRS